MVRQPFKVRGLLLELTPEGGVLVHDVQAPEPPPTELSDEGSALGPAYLRVVGKPSLLLQRTRQ